MQLKPGSIKEARSSTSRFLPELDPVSSSSSRSASCRRSQTPRPRLGMRSSWIKGELQVVGRSSSTYYQYHLGGSLFQVHGPSGFCSSSRTVSAVRHSRRGQLCSEHNLFNLSGEILVFVFIWNCSPPDDLLWHVCFLLKLYVHCSVLVTDQSVDPGLKSCNYNLIQSR